MSNRKLWIKIYTALKLHISMDGFCLQKILFFLFSRTRKEDREDPTKNTHHWIALDKWNI